ncbi:RecX family transcriptional regulator [Acidocella sp.]|uniref:RecX family transcriptional regulator n=1 Tax=Acidocella sp. TaxID=50710 RepID=UPI002634276A|nr:RecX family transcriptional regulator [Acidocella sp.]
MTHLTRYAATEMSLTRVLARKIDRWGRLQTEAGEEAEEVARACRGAKGAIAGVIARLKELGVLNDDAFAAARAKRLRREGKSARAVSAHLAAKGVRGAATEQDPARELAAACAYLRRKRAGPFGAAPEQKILAAMARGGFSQATAQRALKLPREEAEALIASLWGDGLSPAG